MTSFCFTVQPGESSHIERGNQTHIKLSKRLSHHTCYYHCWYCDSFVRWIFSRREIPHNKIHNRIKIVKVKKKSQLKHYLFQVTFITVDSVNVIPQSVPLHIIVCVCVYVYIFTLSSAACTTAKVKFALNLCNILHIHIYSNNPTSFQL